MLGYAGLDNKGLEGLERSLEKVIAGKPGSQTVVKDPFGRALDVVSTQPETPGRNVRLTIDHQVQANAEAVLTETIRQHGARAASAIVMDPHTGAVLAMATAPGFNANRFPTTRADRRRNRAVTDTYEPGSTFKLVTVSAALQEGIVGPSSAFSLAPTLRVADRVIGESHTRGTERMSVREIVERSSNIGTITIAQRLGEGRLANWIERFGFGKRDRNRLPGRVVGIRASARAVVRLDDRNGPDRTWHCGDSHPDGEGVRSDRQRRRARPAASRRSPRREAVRAEAGSANRLQGRLDADARPCFAAS